MIQIFGHKKCKHTRAAERFFKERGIKVHSVDVTEKAMSKGELESVARAVGIEKAFDGDGQRAIDKGLKYSAPTKERMMELLLTDMLLLRTPVVRLGQKAAVGPDEAGWKALAAAEKASK